jgi:hypothetical protein
MHEVCRGSKLISDELLDTISRFPAELFRLQITNDFLVVDMSSGLEQGCHRRRLTIDI